MNEKKSASKHAQPIKMYSDSKHTDKNSVLRILWRGLQMKKKKYGFCPERAYKWNGEAENMHLKMP